MSSDNHTRSAHRASAGIRPYSATILVACGTILVGLGLYFFMMRPPLLPEDARYAGATLDKLQVAAPNIALWLRKVFWVLGGYIVATGILTSYIAMTSFRHRAPGSIIAITIGGIASIGSMTVVNFLINSDFKWPIVGITALWATALVLYWRRV